MQGSSELAHSVAVVTQIVRCRADGDPDSVSRHDNVTRQICKANMRQTEPGGKVNSPK